MDLIVTAKNLRTAEVGDTIWVFDRDRARYENQKYVGRGVFMVDEIVSKTKQSVTTKRGTKFGFDGHQMATRGYIGGYIAFGDDEKRHWEFADNNRRAIMTMVERCDGSVLRQVARAVGYKQP
jgi:hypothetical protein